VLTSLALTGALAVAAFAQNFTVNAGNIINAVLDQPVSTATNKAGDKVRSHCPGGDCGGFPQGTKFYAVLTEVSAKTSKEPGRIKAKFTTAVLPDGTQVAIEAEPNPGSAAQGGTQTTKSQKGKTAAIGAIGGALLADDSGAGALVGGAAGYALGKGKKTKTSELEIPAGTAFQLRMLKTVTVKRPAKKK
jgi:hypothetical protein